MTNVDKFSMCDYTEISDRINNLLTDAYNISNELRNMPDHRFADKNSLLELIDKSVANIGSVKKTILASALHNHLKFIESKYGKDKEDDDHYFYDENGLAIGVKGKSGPVCCEGKSPDDLIVRINVGINDTTKDIYVRKSDLEKYGITISSKES